MTELVEALGVSPIDEPELKETPARVADLYAEVLSGLAPGAEPELATFPAGSEGDEAVVIVRDLPFYSMCVHHLVPFFGHAHIAYLPGKKILGISGMAR